MVAYFYSSVLSGKLEVLWDSRNYRTGKYGAIFTDSGAIIYYGM
jgi:hypothetical protein